MPTRTRRIAGLTTFAIGAAVLVGSLASPARAQSPGNEDNITICHRTNSNGNPYVEVTTDPSGQNGGTDHMFEHQGPLWNPGLKAQKIEWGDVIPPSAAHPDGSQAYQELLAGGVTFEDFLANGCEAPEAPEVPTFDVTLDKALGANPPANDPDFTFTVVCESGTVPASPVTVKASAGPVVVAEGVAVDDTCTITETGAAGASAVTYQVTGGTAESAGATVTFSVTADASVIATNDFPAPVTVTDACPSLAGVQASVAECPPVVLGNTQTPTTRPATQVAGVQLPRTGGGNGELALLGLGFVLIGAGAVVTADDRRRLVARKA